ncbi:hypothetical protein RND81_03G230600 [Saponaria officinalis]|uniref:Uncharacterized protein n=1 Tax=Saponaria officinalis TaxID=3572 RepID=A0AAW1MBC9_SAPOF
MNSINNNKNVTKNNPTKKCSSISHRTPSFSSTSSFTSTNSSSSSSSSSFRSSSLEQNYSQPSTLSTSSGVPFSWETIPGIPKKIDPSRKKLPHGKNYLPLPPPVSTTTTPNKNFNQKKHYIARSDPFFDALVECSKGGDEESNNNNNNKSLSRRFGLVNMSCKKSSCVAQSLVFLPRSGLRRISYDVLKKSND